MNPNQSSASEFSPSFNEEDYFVDEDGSLVEIYPAGSKCISAKPLTQKQKEAKRKVQKHRVLLDEIGSVRGKIRKKAWHKRKSYLLQQQTIN